MFMQGSATISAYKYPLSVKHFPCTVNNGNGVGSERGAPYSSKIPPLAMLWVMASEPGPPMGSNTTRAPWPLELVNDALRKGTLVALLPGYNVPASPMNLLYAADRRTTPKVRSFLDFVKGVFGRDEVCGLR